MVKGGTLYYIHTDNLGSIQAITDESKNTISSYYYTPWGARVLLSGVNITDRGYTFHEHLEAFCLINMNGRVYDPMLARFLSPDPYVQAPDNTQGFNRYSYCLNNPFKYTDPDGEFWQFVIGAVVGGAMNWVSNGCEFSWEGLSYFGAGAVAGVATAAAPGSFALISGALSAANSAISQGFQNGWNNIKLDQVAFSGIIGGATSYAGAQLSPAFNGAFNKLGINDINSPLFREMTKGIVTNSFIGGTLGGVGALGDNDPNTTFWTGSWGGIKMGAVTGTVGGIGGAVSYSAANKVNLLSGKPMVVERVAPMKKLPIPEIKLSGAQQPTLPEHIQYPPNNGAIGETTTEYLMPGTVVDRVGGTTPTSRYLSPAGTPIESRSLPPNTNLNILDTYQIQKPIPVTTSTIAPYWGQSGLGKQYLTPLTIQTLLRRGIIIKIP